jgi:hypothetical protein
MKDPTIASDSASLWSSEYRTGLLFGMLTGKCRIKSLLFTLVRAFEFEPAVPEDGIGFSASAVRRPNVIAEPEAGNQLPLIVRPYVAS